MNIKIYQDRKLLNEDSNFGSENENLATTLIFEFPEYIEKDGVQIAIKDLNKTIVFDIEGDNELPIEEDKFSFPYEITKLGEVVWNICLKEKSETEDMTDKLIWYSETMKSTFIKTNEGHNEITTEKIDVFNSMLTRLNNGIQDVEESKAYIEQLKIDVESGKFNGKDGVDGKDGQDGYSPVKGKDYWTPEDRTEIINEIDNKVQEDLKNYYLKSETYNKEEIDNKISLIPKFDIKVVDKLPTENIEETTVYLVKSGEESQNLYTEYIYTNGKWEQLGTQKLDLSGFYNKDQINSMLATRDSRITALEEENRTQTERIETLEKENENQAEELETLWKDYKEKEVEGETVSIADGIWKPKTTIRGMSKQNTTEGYQLLDESSIEGYTNVDTIKDNLVTTIEMTGEGNINSSIKINAFDIETGDYYISCKARLKSGSVASVNSILLLGSGFTVDSTEWIEKPTISNSFQRYCRKYTVSSDGSGKASRFSFQVNSPNNAVLELIDFQVSPVDKPYEKFTGGQASPNTEYEQEIEVIDGVNRLNPANLSLFNSNKYIQTKTRIEVEANTEYSIVSNKAFTDMSVNAYSDDTNNEKLTITTTVKGNKRYYTFTTKADTKTLFFYTGQDTEYTTVEEFIKTLEMMLIKGTDDKPYLPYGHIGLIQRGIQLLDFSKAKGGTNSGITATINDNGTYDIKGTVTSPAINIWLLGGYVSSGLPTLVTLKKGVSYYIRDAYLFVGTSDVSTTSGKGGRVLIPTSDLNITAVRVPQLINGKVYDETLYPIIAELPSALTELNWEPYIKPKTIEIDLAGNSIAKGDNVEISVKGNTKANKIMKGYVLTGKETITRYSTATTGIHRFAISNLGAKPTPDNYTLPNIYCNLFIADTPNQNYNKIESITVDRSGNIIIYSDKTKTMTVDEFKTWLTENSIEILYELEETEVIPLPSIEPIKLIEGITNVFELVTNLGTTMKVEYKVSNKSRLEKLELALLSNGGNV